MLFTLSKRRWSVAGAFGECHLKTWSAMPHVSVAGLYTLERERGETLCRQYGGRNYSSLDELACDPTIDVVSIATPEDAHLESFKVLAAAGKAIYVEKPLATSLMEAGGDALTCLDQSLR